MELGVPAAACLADTIGQGPPFAPPTVRWTLMQVLSMNSRSGTSSAPASALKMFSQIPRSAQRTKRPSAGSGQDCRASSWVHRPAGNRPSARRFAARGLLPDSTRRSSTRLAPLPLTGRSGSIRDHWLSENQKKSAIPNASSREALNHIGAGLGIPLLGPDPSKLAP